MIEVALATEDELSEAVGCRLLEDATPHLHPGLTFRKNGSGYLRASMDKWCSLVKRQPIVLLTDLDQMPCAGALLETWFQKHTRHRDFVLRVAVREVESWLLADHEAMKHLLGKRGRLPPDPDSLSDPKQQLLYLAQGAERSVREALVAQRGSLARQGLQYNAYLCDFVNRKWDPRRASTRSDSLRRARKHIGELARRIHSQ